MSITIDAPTAEIPVITEQLPAPDALILEKAHALEVTAARLAKDRYAALLLAAVYDQARQREAKRARTAEHNLAVLLDSCFARQAALTDPAVREQRLMAQLKADREYAGKLERFLEAADSERRVLVERQAALIAENSELRLRIGVAEAVQQPRGRRRRRP
jgi:hypothetical protein